MDVISANNASSANNIIGGDIVLETNYRLYAYTASALQIAVLNLFTDMLFRFDNMVCGQLTQESTKDAFDAGITADQIISYLTAHAHPQMIKNGESCNLTNPLPASVRDQIRLWYLDRKRIALTKGMIGFAFIGFYL